MLHCSCIEAGYSILCFRDTFVLQDSLYSSRQNFRYFLLVRKGIVFTLCVKTFSKQCQICMALFSYVHTSPLFRKELLIRQSNNNCHRCLWVVNLFIYTLPKCISRLKHCIFLWVSKVFCILFYRLIHLSGAIL